MNVETYIALAVGVIFSLIYAEMTGVLPAGLVVPGYLAMAFTSPMIIISTLLIAFLTYLVVMHVVGRFTILYGRRKFTAMLLVGIVLRVGFDYFVLVPTPFGIFELQALGVVIPGLIANTIQRQGVIPTVASTIALSASTYFVVWTYNSIM